MSDIVRLYAIVLIVAMVCATVIFIVKSTQNKHERDEQRRDKWMNEPLEKFSDQDLENLERRYQTPEERAEADAAKRRDHVGDSANTRDRRSHVPGINVTINSGNSYSDNFRDAQSANYTNSQPTSTKSRLAAFLLCFFFGCLGVHYFYVGRPGMGVLYLITLGFWGIGVVIDLFRIVLGRFPDRNGAWI